MTGTTRRVFLLSSASAGGVLALGFSWPTLGLAARSKPAAADLNAFVRIGPEDTITLQVPCSEMGQGIHTGLAQVLADELDADWSQIRVEVPQPQPGYDNPAFGAMLTVGSQSMRQYFEPLRKAGATARAMLVAAAASRWNVRADALRTERSQVIGPAGQLARFSELAGDATRSPVPEKPQLKDRRDWKLIGVSQPRLEARAKVDGTAVFGGDLRLPDLLHAAIRQCPVRGGRLGTVTNESEVLKRRYVTAVVQLDPDAVAVVAEHQGDAISAVEALDIEWDESEAGKLAVAEVDRAFIEAIEADAGVGSAESTGRPDSMLAEAERIISADYELPFLAHVPMEPPSCTARVDAQGCEIWVPTQGQTFARFAAAQAAGVDPSLVRVHTTLLGGGFGRKSPTDFVVQTVRIAATDRIRGRPVQLCWTREEDIQHDFYRPRTRHRLRGVLAADGLPAVWTHRIAAPSIALSATPMRLQNDVDPIVVEGAVHLPYAIAHRKVEYARCEVGMRVGFWRSVGWSANVYAVESFIDELAHAAGRDPYDYRRALLADKPRHLAVLESAAQAANWTKPAPAGRHRGIAFTEQDGSLCAQVAEVSVDDDGRLTVRRVVCALDCGTVVNPALVREQVVGATLFGLSATLFEEITVDLGRLGQKNFDGYRILRISDTPEVEVHMIDSTEPPTGVGEIATSPINAAVCNALFAATGRRVRILPLQRDRSIFPPEK